MENLVELHILDGVAFFQAKEAKLKSFRSFAWEGIRSLKSMKKILTLGNVEFSIATNESVPFPLMISSHERSGTHFLINSIALNSEFTNNPLIHFDSNFLGPIVNFHSAKGIRNFFHTLAEKKCSSIIKNHFASEFFVDGIDNNLISENLKVIYIARDPFHALASYCRFINFLNMKEGPRIANLKLFIRSEPRWGMTRYQDRQYANIAERWANHVLGWYRLSLEHKNICFVTYQDIHENYIEAMGKIFEFLKIPAETEFERPDARKNTIYIPNRNQIEIGDEKTIRSEIWKLLPDHDTELLKRILKLN